MNATVTVTQDALKELQEWRRLFRDLDSRPLSPAAAYELYYQTHTSREKLLEVVQAMANFDGRNITTHLKEMARAALAKAQQTP